MKNKKTLSNLKDLFLFILIIILSSFPLLKEIKPFAVTMARTYVSTLKLIGMIGVYFLVFNIYINFNKSEDKKKYFKKILPILILLLYMVWTLISSIYAKDTKLAFYGTIYRQEGYITYIAYAGCFGLAYCLSSKKLRKSALYIFVIIAILTATFAHLRSNGYLKNIIFNVDNRSASFDQFNHYGYYLLMASAISSFLFITEKNKIVKICNILIYAFLLYCLIINDTFGCYLALISNFIVFFLTVIIKKEKKMPIIILISIFIITSFVVTNGKQNIASRNLTTMVKDVHNIATKDSSKAEWGNAGTGRMILWKYGLQFFKERPILGHGPENLGDKYLKVGINQDRPHNLLIQLATTSGLPGLILYISAIGVILVRSFKKIKMENQLHVISMFSVIAYLISAMFGNSMYYTSPYYFILLGMLMSELINIDIEDSHNSQLNI